MSDSSSTSSVPSLARPVASTQSVSAATPTASETPSIAKSSIKSTSRSATKPSKSKPRPTPTPKTNTSLSNPKTTQSPKPTVTPPSWAPAPWVPGKPYPHMPQDPNDGQTYVHIITHECLEGDALRCIIKGVPAGSEVEPEDYVRVADIVKVFDDQYSPPAIGWPSTTEIVEATSVSSNSPDPTSTVPTTFATVSTSRVPDQSAIVSGTSSSSSSTISLPTASSVSTTKDPTSTTSLPTPSSSSSTLSSDSSTISLPTPSTTSTPASQSPKIECTECSTTTTVSTTTTATTTATVSVVSAVSTISTVPTVSTVSSARPVQHVKTKAKAKAKAKYIWKDENGHWHHSLFTDEVKTQGPSNTQALEKRAEPTATMGAGYQLQKDLHARMPERKLDHFFKVVTRTSTRTMPAAADSTLHVDGLNGITEPLSEAASDGPGSYPPQADLANPVLKSVMHELHVVPPQADIAAIMQDLAARPLAEDEFINPNNHLVKALSEPFGGPAATPVSVLEKLGDMEARERAWMKEHEIGQGILVAVTAVMGLVVLGLSVRGVRRWRKKRVARNAVAAQKLAELTEA